MLHNMPFKSLAQSKWGHSEAGLKALGGVDKVKEWESHTDYSRLPSHMVKNRTKSSIMKKLLKNKNEQFGKGKTSSG